MADRQRHRPQTTRLLPSLEPKDFGLHEGVRSVPAPDRLERSTGTSGSTEPTVEQRPKRVRFQEHRSGRATRESCKELRREAAYDADRAPIRQGSPATFAKMRREIVGEAVFDPARAVAVPSSR
ncbi:MAG TPA: hypothetical protein DCQ98_00790 [Planctomycetaceae bacterium]|nr:hypothetical protein [Planctomycetaceae bacterium]